MRKIIKVMGKPGTGKTTFLANKMIELNEKGVSYDEMLFTSFSRSAARAMWDKLYDKQGIQRKDLNNFGTLHSLSSKTLELKKENFIDGLSDYIWFCGRYSIDFDPAGKTIKKIEDIDGFGITGDKTVCVEGNILFDWWQRLKLVYETDEIVKKMMKTYFGLSTKEQDEMRNRDIEQIMLLLLNKT